MTRRIREISSTGGNLGEPPKSCELEVSIFGPGYGECVLIHLGNKEWMIVDSCINPNTNSSAPLDYLHRIGIDPSKTIKLIVATHWHDDHIRGLGDVVSECEAAQFVCSSALRPLEFLTLVQAYGKRSMMETSGIQEFSRILDVMKSRANSRQASFSPHWAMAERLLWRRPPMSSGYNLYSRWIKAITRRLLWWRISSTSEPILPCEIYALSPSDASINLAYHRISSLIPQERETKRRIVAQPPNHVAVVLWVKVGNISILLGSDLEETKETNTEWSIIVDSTTRPSERASIFKVPHHGSENADNPRVWDEMLETSPIAVLTPFISGSIILPTKSDTVRILRRTDKSYSTAVARPGRRINRHAAVEKTIRETVRRIRQMHGFWGHVRIRKNILMSQNGEWNVELFEDALPLRNMYAVNSSSV